jgi:trans-aconitate 2-methyltransferase
MEAKMLKQDWSASQYLKFNTERTRPVHDLLSQVLPHMTKKTPRIYDLGCGPGNSTSALLSAFPDALVTGMDASPDMLRKARHAVPEAEFVEGDLATFRPDEDADVIFSNAAFHWLRSPTRIPALVHLLEGMKPGGVLALQVPDNYNEPTHRLMRDTALLPAQPWSEAFAPDATRIGNLDDEARPDLDPIETPAEFYNALLPYAALVSIWRTLYIHPLGGAAAIVEWVKGTGLRPFLDRITDAAAREAYLDAYERGIEGAYEKTGDGKVLLGYPRLFVVAVRK